MASPVTVKIKFKSPDTDHFVERYAVDVSESGIFIRTPKPLAIGTTVNFEFQLQDSSPLMSGNGTVVWVRAMDSKKVGGSAGMGIRFDKLGSHSQTVLEQVMNHKRRAEQFADEPTVAGDPQQALELADAAAATDAIRKSASMGQVAKLASSGNGTSATASESTSKSADPTKRVSQDRSGRLENILFSDQSNKAESEQKTDSVPQASVPEEAATAAGDSAAAIEPAAAATPTFASTPASGKSKSSALVWWIILAVFVAAGIAFLLQMRSGGEQTPAEAKAAVVVPKPKPPPAPPPKVSVSVTSSPEGAKVLLNGQDTGKTTPTQLDDLIATQAVDIAFDLPGKKLINRNITPGKEKAVAVDLNEPAERALNFISEPSGAAVIYNWKKIGVTPLVSVVEINPKRRNRVIFRLKGFVDGRVTVPKEPEWTREGEREVYTVATTLAPRSARRKRAARAPAKAPEPAAAEDAAATGGDPAGTATEVDKTADVVRDSDEVSDDSAARAQQ